MVVPGEDVWQTLLNGFYHRVDTAIGDRAGVDAPGEDELLGLLFAILDPEHAQVLASL